MLVRRAEMMKLWMLQTKKTIGFDMIVPARAIVYDGFVIRDKMRSEEEGDPS
jgi:hypothetical protein